MYPFKDDAKICRLDDLSFRLLWVAFEFANAAPWRLGRQGWLYHNEGFPVAEVDFQRAVPHHTAEEVKAALDTLCTLGGAKHTLLQRDEKRKAWRIRAWRKWQDGFARDFAKKAPKKHRDSAAIDLRPKTLDLSGADTPAGVGELQEYFLERSRRHTGLAKPPFPYPRSGDHFKMYLGPRYEHSVKAITATIDYFFDHWIREKGGGAFSHYQGQYLALCKAVQEGR